MNTDKAKLNWLRAAVLGANDGIVSIAALVIGVAGASNNIETISIAGIAGLIAGALSMAAGEYISVSTQRDAEKAYIEKEKIELQRDPAGELQELAEFYRNKGLSEATATTVAMELTKKDPLAAHLQTEFSLDEEDLTNPWHAAVASAVSFVGGGIIPILTITLSGAEWRIGLTFISVIAALALTGYGSAWLSSSNRAKAMARVIIGGSFAMIATYGIGTLFGVSA